MLTLSCTQSVRKPRIIKALTKEKIINLLIYQITLCQPISQSMKIQLLVIKKNAFQIFSLLLNLKKIRLLKICTNLIFTTTLNQGLKVILLIKKEKTKTFKIVHSIRNMLKKRNWLHFHPHLKVRTKQY